MTRLLRHRPTLLSIATALLANAAGGQIIGGPAPPPIDWEQKLGANLPLDTTFRSHEGKEVQLGDYFGERPVILALVYYECPMLCNLLLDGLIDSLRQVEFTTGEEFSLVAVSIDHEETPELAAGKRAAYLEAYGREEAAEDWHFLVGEPTSIQAVADAVGFQYAFVPETGEYAHGAGVTILTNDGVVSSVLLGLEFEPRDVRLGLVEAAKGEIGSPIDQILLRCFHYDPAKGQYGFAIMSVLRASGLATVAVLLIVVLRNFLRERSAMQQGATT